MTISDHIPTEQLRPFIKGYKIIESQGEMANRVLPTMSQVIAFRYRGEVNYLTDHTKHSLPTTTITGLKKSVRLINYLTDTATLIVLFKPAGAAAFFKAPLHELFEESVSLDHFIAQQKISDVEEHLAEAQCNSQRIAFVEQFLLSELHHHSKDHLIEHAIQIIHAMMGVIRVKELADKLCISQDAFEKRFRKSIGSSPKQFSSIVRMKSVIDQGHQSKSLSAMAFDNGYFDQPHFNKDFKLFTGQTPTEFFKSPRLW